MTTALRQGARVALLFVLALLLVASPASAQSYGYGSYGGYGRYGGRRLMSSADLDFEPALTHSRGLLATYGSGYGYGGYGTYGRRRLLSETSSFQPRRSLLASYGGYGYGYGY